MKRKALGCIRRVGAAAWQNPHPRFTRGFSPAMQIIPLRLVFTLAVTSAIASLSLAAAVVAPTVPAPATTPAAATSTIAASVTTSGVNGYSSLANLVTLPAILPGERSFLQLRSTAFVWERLEVRPNGTTGERRNVSDLATPTIERLEIHISTLNPGQNSHAPHRHGNEEFIILKDGTLEVGLGGVTADVSRVETVGPGGVFFFAGNQYHNVENKGAKPATYLVFNLHTATTPRTPPEGTPSAPVPVGLLNSVIFDWEKSVARPSPTGSRREIFNGPTLSTKNFECVVITLNPGQTDDSPVQRPEEQLLAVKDGRLDVTTNGQTIRGGPGTIFFISTHDLHTVKNATNEPVSYHLFRITTELTPKTATPAPAKVAGR
jgi:quercetin dioxygenase-like cupin family protein